MVRKILELTFWEQRFQGVPQIPITEKFCDFSYHRDGQDVRYSLDDSKLRAMGWDNKCKLDIELPAVVAYYRDKFVW